MIICDLLVFSPTINVESDVHTYCIVPALQNEHMQWLIPEKPKGVGLNLQNNGLNM